LRKIGESLSQQTDDRVSSVRFLDLRDHELTAYAIGLEPDLVTSLEALKKSWVLPKQRA
jgi:hypothetical protein